MGVCLTWNGSVMAGDLASGLPVDAGVLFGKLGSVVQGRYTDLALAPDLVGVNIAKVKTRLSTARDAADSILNSCVAVAVWGFDVEPGTNRDRLYLRKINYAQPTYSLTVPGANTGKRQTVQATGDVVNVLTVEGGAPDYPQLLPNGSFEDLIFAGGGAGLNCINDGGFENAGQKSVGGLLSQFLVTPWTFSGDNGQSASVKNNKGTHSGAWALEMDTFNEAATAAVNVMAIPAIVPGDTYEFGAWMRPENVDQSNPPQVRMSLWWRVPNGSGGYADTLAGTQTVTVVQQQWNLFYQTYVAPVGATGYHCEFRVVGGNLSSNSRGVLIDDTYLSDISGLRAAYWKLIPTGGNVWAQNWQAGNAFDGFNCLYMNVGANDVDGQDVNLKIDPAYLFNVVGGSTVRFALRVKAVAGRSLPILLGFFQVRSGGRYDDGFPAFLYDAPNRLHGLDVHRGAKTSPRRCREV